MLDSRAFHWGISNQVLNKINHKTFLHKPEYNFLMTFKTLSFLNVSAKISTENAIEQTCRRNQWWIKLPSTSYKYYSDQYLMISVTDIWWSLTPMNQSLIKYILRNRERNFHKIFFFFFLKKKKKVLELINLLFLLDHRSSVIAGSFIWFYYSRQLITFSNSTFKNFATISMVNRFSKILPLWHVTATNLFRKNYNVVI